MDLEKVFDTVNPDVLMARVARKVRDKTVVQFTAWGDTARFTSSAAAGQHPIG